jgi:SAM-dependent methyltransferase
LELLAANEGHRWADPEFLRKDQYRSDVNLRARQSIYAFQYPRVDLPRVVLDLAAPTSDDRVVDVGCGNGAYLFELGRRDLPRSLIGVDLSEGMLRAASQAMPRAQMLLSDASALPLRDGTATLVLAMHMLYHVPQPAVAVSEFRRVLAPGGRVVVVLNAEDHLRELRHAVDEALQELGLPADHFGERVRLDQGEELLAREFGSVTRNEFESELVLRDLAPLEAYLRSSINTATVAEEGREDYVRQVVGRLSPDPLGVVRVKTHPGCLVCS